MRRVTISSGGIELLKWLGLVLMTGDHINKYLFNGTLPVLFEAGRLCIPIFSFVLAYNLARPDAISAGVHQRVMLRLFVFGALASAPFIYLGGLYQGWWPLNVLFTLLAITSTLYLIERGGSFHWLAAVVFVFGGSMVEYWWPAIAFGAFAWWYLKDGSPWAVLGAILSCLALTVINGNYWALAALPIIFGAAQVNINIPRLRWVFYLYYPAHLVVIALIRIPMSKAGYLFF